MNPRISGVTAKSNYIVELSFTDGSRGSVDLSRYVVGSKGVFAALKDPAFFAQVTVDADAGTIVWPNGADLDPDVLYDAAQAASGRQSETRRAV